MVGDEGIVLYSHSSRGVELECSLPWMVPSFDEQLLDVLKGANQSHPVLILYDAVEQYYRREALPKIGAMDRSKVMERKLAMAFPNYPIRAAVELKDVKKQKDMGPSYLFVALPESEQLERINQVLFQAEVPIAGLALLPVESAGLVKGLAESYHVKGKIKSKWSVFIGQHQTGGLRQVVVNGNDLGLTRLTPLPEGALSNPEVFAGEVLREFKATLSYISRLGYQPDDGLDVFVACGAEEKKILQAVDVPVANFRCISQEEAAKALGLKLGNQDDTQFSDALHAAWSANKFKPEMAVKVKKLNRVAMPRAAARAASITLVLGVMGFIGVNAYYVQEHAVLEEEIEHKTVQRKSLQRDYEEEAKVFDTLPVKPDVIKGTIAAKQLVEKFAMQPGPFLMSLKQAFGEEFFLVNFSMEHKLEDKHLTIRSLESKERAGGRNQRRNPRASVRNMRQAGKTDERGLVKITFDYILPGIDDLEQKVTASEDLLVRLRMLLPNHKINVIAQFGNISRTGGISGSIGSDERSNSATGDVASIEIEGEPIWLN